MAASPILFDRELLRQRLLRALRGKPVTFLLDHVATEMVDRLSVVKRSFSVAADIGTPSGALRKLMRDRKLAETIIGVDSLAMSGVRADEEALPFADGSLDLVVSALSLQWVNDLPGTLAQIRRALKPDGLFMAALLGGDTLTELRQSFASAEAEIEGGASPHVSPFADVRELGALLQRAGLALPVADVDKLTVRYATPFDLMADLRGMGATNALIERRRAPLKRGTLRRMAEIYADRFSDGDGRLRATFEIVWLSGWAPHESQQQPLRPGSEPVSVYSATKTAARSSVAGS